MADWRISLLGEVVFSEDIQYEGKESGDVLWDGNIPIRVGGEFSSWWNS